ncbi:cellobiose transport system substrate-binding protein [Streptosporangium becharense]|uniref:Cellobiose transport system substrate-binding protein n=1 Tax=Streptosporangium becharense TaxID=1816182 RepID=A0A7W9ILK1_9ACTN|nr:extracellular solute-binding protein [Streptosporangium becharense]MBB2910144.1 cellobiose transport system substrate-binding protein [Streptosporangium becharense]MBB5822887.1 cellobiose transport system substrate-binding protein [Streptosporangium becharense]
MLNSKRQGRLAAVAVMAVTALAITSCGSGEPAGSTASGGAAAEPVTITVHTFGGGENFGYDKAVEKWNAEHPNIQVKYQNLTDRFEDVYLPQLLQKLQAGSGAADIVGIDEGAMGLMKARSQFFADLSQYGLESRKADFPAAKWENGLNKDGKLFALGTDIGGMTMCYRTDLFEKAGLPTDREEVGKLWPDWNAFMETGKKFQAANKGKDDPKFIDGPNTLYNVLLSQEAPKNGNISYFDKSNQLVIGTNPAIKTAFDTVKSFSEAGLTAKLASFTPEWNAAIKKGGFATMGCPAWMLGVVSGAAGDENKGKWDVAAVPGGAGNWGGSYLAVPKQSKHPKEAAEVLNYLTGKEGHVLAFQEAAAFPSSIPAQQDPAVAELKNEFFNDAPTGQIFGASVKDLLPVFLGEKHAQVKTAAEKVLEGMDKGSIPYGEAWTKFVEAGTKAAG